MIENEVIITKEEIDEISLIVSHAYADIYEGVYCRLDNREKEFREKEEEVRMDYINKIICGDCIEVMKKIPDKSIDLILTDMPYEDKVLKWIPICFEKLKDIGSIYIITDYRSVCELKLELDKLGIFKNWIVWCYRGIARKIKGFQYNHDDILFYTKSDNYVWNQPYQPSSDSTIKRWGKYADNKGNVPLGKLTPTMRKRHKSMSIRNTRMRDWWIDIPIVGFKEAPNGKFHKYQKPIDLIKRIIMASSNENDIVLDPFLGSGTTAVACKELGRRYIGIEISSEYCEIAKQRIMAIPEFLFN